MIITMEYSKTNGGSKIDELTIIVYATYNISVSDHSNVHQTMCAGK